MKTRYEIEVTERDCAEGVRCNSVYCVASTATARAIPGATHIETVASTIRFTIEDDGRRFRLVYPTPDPVRDYLIDFDRGADFKPMRFILDNPSGITEVFKKAPGAARTPSFKAKAKAKGTGARRSLRIFGERALKVNQQAATA